MKLRLAAALLVVLGLSCGRPAESGRQPDTVHVGIEQMGRAVGLKVGDRLVVSLGEEPSSVAYRWELVRYPEKALDLLSSDQEAGLFEFAATGEGGGRMELTGHPVCERGQTDSAGEIQCPLLGAGAPGGVPFRLFVIDVRVSGD
jgi:hypothetical protein